MSRIDETLALDRRRFLRASVTGAVLLAVGGALIGPRLFATDARPAGKPGDVVLETFSRDGRDLGKKKLPRLVLSPAQWRKRLTPAQFNILRESGTEMAFSGPHEQPSQPGLFRCVGCDTALYNANTEFDSGTGWPSFWQPIAESNIARSGDSSFGMSRTAISCARCNGHLGHVFHDGPKPTGLRFCMNSLALKFVPFSS